MSYQLHYCLQGNSRHPVLMFLHGFMGSSKSFDAAISDLSDQFLCLAVDLPGHGNTQTINQASAYTMPQTAQALLNLLDYLQIKTCGVVGYSMGGRLALYLALHFPQRFSRAVLESASPGLKTLQERQDRIRHDLELAEQLETRDFSSFLTDWYQQPLFSSLKQHPDFSRLMAELLHNRPWELAKSLRGMGTGFQSSLWDLLPSCQIPLLFMVGEGDRKFKTINLEMANLCVTAQLKVIPNCGHNIHFENLQAFAVEIRNFYLE